MARIDPALQALLQRIDARVGDFVYEPGKPLNRVLFSRMLKDKLSFDDSARDQIRLFIDELAAATGRSTLDSEAFFKLVRHGATTGEIPDNIGRFLASAPALTLGARANNWFGNLWEWARSNVEWAGTKIWENETLRAGAGIGLGALGGYLAFHMFDALARSMGPEVPFLSTAFAFPVAITGAIMAFTMIRQQFPSNAVIEERERNRAAAPVREKVTSLEPALGAEPELSVRPVMTSHLAGVGFKAAGISLDNGGAEEVTVPALRGETGVILRG